MNKQHTLHSEYSQPLSLCLPCSLHRQLPALACTKLRSKAHDRVAVTNVLPSCDGKRASDTHGALY